MSTKGDVFMRSRRIKEGQTIVFDAKELFEPHKGMVLLEMRRGPMSYTTEEGVRFWKKHPYQWVSKEESNMLLKSKSPEFVKATRDDLEDYYSYD
jgi:tRNA nucleotidyltransferase (CCA-adding enzyme)